MTYAVARPAPTKIVVEQVDRRTLGISFPVDPEDVARLLNEAGVEGFTLTGAKVDGNDGGLSLGLTRTV